ncbi:MAG: 3'-5' exoribonuclease [Gemmataceae bacterium]|nr:3'-5' exoribonuclease [Gemmataceae bacterium]
MSLAHLPGPIAVVDVETTGLFPFRHDRVVEIAAVILGTDGTIKKQFVSLVNPTRDIGPTSIHGLTSEDILDAPKFDEIAPHVLELLDGVVAVAAHNVRFDRLFIDTEFSRIGCDLPDYSTMCTMQLAGGGKLRDCCRQYSITQSGEGHSALDDALAAARLLVAVFEEEPHTIRQLKRNAVPWPKLGAPVRQPITREQSRQRQAAPPEYIQRLMDRRGSEPFSVASDGAMMAYGALLDRVLEDRRVDSAEADALVEMANRWGLNRNQIVAAHRDYLLQLAIAAVADGVVTDSERRDLKMVAKLLGQPSEELDQVLTEAASRIAEVGGAKKSPASANESLAGKRVCFTGELQCTCDGTLISRDKAEALATAAGLVPVGNVSKKLDLLVLADPNSQSGKAKKARDLGVRIIHEPLFWKSIGVRVG